MLSASSLQRARFERRRCSVPSVSSLHLPAHPHRSDTCMSDALQQAQAAVQTPSLRARLKEGMKDITAGTIAGMTSKCIEMPFDTLKTRLQTSTLYKGPMDCLTTIVRNEGFFSLYRGIAAPIYGAMAENAIMFLAYGEAKRMLTTPGQQLPLWGNALAGSFAGIVVAHWMTPVELVKCRMQVAGSPYSGVFDCIRQTWRAEGLGGFFRGHSGTLLREGPGNACYFAGYETFCRLLTPEGQKRSELSPWRLMAAGALGGIAYWTSFFPADVVKSRMQTDSSSGARAGFVSTFRSIYSSQGIRGLYSGLGVTLIRAVPANACIFYCYEMTLRALTDLEKGA